MQSTKSLGFRRHSFMGLLWRVVLAGLLFVPVFRFFGVLAFAVVGAHYQDPSFGLVVPSFEVVLLVETVRGLLLVLTVYLLIAILGRRLSQRGQAFWVALTLACLGAWSSMLNASFFPLAMRVVHGLEITADAIVHSVLIIWLLGLDSSKAK